MSVDRRHRARRPRGAARALTAAMLLGDLLAEIEQASAAGSAVALLDDLVLVARVNEAAAHRSMQAEAYVISAVRRFEREASDADWTTLISAVSAGTNPGSACLRRMVEHVLKQDEQGPR